MFTNSLLFFLLSLALAVFGQELPKKEPVDLTKAKHVVIEKYNGPLSYDTLILLGNVEDLHLKNSNFTSFNLSFLLALPNLKRLLISSCTTQAVDHDITGCCEKLEDLEITYDGAGDLGEVELKMISAMRALKRLVLHNMRFRVLEEGIITSPNISQLTIFGCNLHKIKNNAFEKLRELERLNLEFNMLTEFKKEVFAPLTKVKLISLKGNFLEELTVGQIPFLPNLEKIKVSYNRIEDINLEGIKTVAPKLKSVDISGSGISAVESGGIKLIHYNFG